jgi:hypothetical protein
MTSCVLHLGGTPQSVPLALNGAVDLATSHGSLHLQAEIGLPAGGQVNLACFVDAGFLSVPGTHPRLNAIKVGTLH